MVERVRLRDGTDAMIWPLLPTDREALREEYERLSPDARYHRFLGAVPHLTEELLDRLVDDVDGVDHVALVLFALPDDGPDDPAGIARIVRYAERPTAADVGVTVIDHWQGRGVATALLDALMRHRPVGVTEIVTEVAADNPASLAMLRRLGELTATPSGRGTVEVVVQIRDDPATAPGSAEASERDPRRTSDEQHIP